MELYVALMALFVLIVAGAGVLTLFDAARYTKCPACYKRIDRRATICPYCRTEFDDDEPEPAPPARPRTAPPPIPDAAPSRPTSPGVQFLVDGAPGVRPRKSSPPES